MERVWIEPLELSRRDSYFLMISAIVPRPIALVSTVDDKGVANVAPFSYFQGITSDPPYVMLSVGRRQGVPKDTLQNIECTQDFVVNVVTEEILEKAVQTAAPYPPEVDEAKEVGFTLFPARKVKSPCIAESPVNLECRLLEMIVLGNSLQYLVIGEVVGYQISQEVLTEDGVIDPRKLKPVGRLGGSFYCPVREIWEVPTPKVAKTKD